MPPPPTRQMDEFKEKNKRNPTDEEQYKIRQRVLQNVRGTVQVCEGLHDRVAQIGVRVRVRVSVLHRSHRSRKEDSE